MCDQTQFCWYCVYGTCCISVWFCISLLQCFGISASFCINPWVAIWGIVWFGFADCRLTVFMRTPWGLHERHTNPNPVDQTMIFAKWVVNSGLAVRLCAHLLCVVCPLGTPFTPQNFCAHLLAWACPPWACRAPGGPGAR